MKKSKLEVAERIKYNENKRYFELQALPYHHKKCAAEVCLAHVQKAPPCTVGVQSPYLEFL